MTNTASAAPKALKADSLGRVHRPAEQRERILDEFESSGLGGVRFAALVAIKYQTLASWVIRRRKATSLAQPSSKPVDSVRWLEAVVADAQEPRVEACTTLKIQLPGGAWLEINTAKQAELVVAVVRALEKPLSC
jgi:hypothetical protein